MSVFQEKDSLLGVEFQVQEDKVCYMPLKDKCDTIRNLESPKTLRQTRAFCGMVNFLSSFLPNLCRLLILIYDLQKKAKKFKWTVYSDLKVIHRDIIQKDSLNQQRILELQSYN